MDTPLRVLFVAASASDAGPLQEELARAGLEVSWEVACNAAEMQTALGQEGWDLVLSDYEIPGFGALPALALAEAAGVDVPFLVVSDAAGEDNRERVLRAGARNCVARGSLPGLASSVERELAESRLRRERRRARQALSESESRFHALAETTSDAILTADGHGRIVFANRAAERVFGQPVAAIVGRPIERLVPGVLALAAAADGEPAPYGPVEEHVGVHASGREFPLQLSIGSLTRDGRRFATVVARDVTERRTAEKALRESEERFRVVAQISSDLVYEWNIETGEVVFFHARPGSSRGVSSTREEWEKLLHPEDRDRVVASMRRTLETDHPFLEEYRIVLASGSVRVRVGYGKVLRDGEGRPLKWIGVNKDVTEQHRIQNALKESEQKLRTLVTNVPVVLFAIDRHGTFTHSEGKGLESLGLEPGEVVGKSVWDLYRKYPDVLEHVRRALSGDAHTATVRLGGISFETRYAPYRDADGGVVGVIGVATDVTEQRRADQALHSSELRYRTLFERNLAGVFRSTLEGRILECNESFARIFGYASPEEALHKPALDFYLRPGDRKTFLTRLSERHTVSNLEMCARRRDGTPVWVLENATLVEGPDGAHSLIEGTVIDITERKRAEEQVKHLAFHDALTGLPNRLLLNDRLTVALAQAHRSRQKLALLFLDLDRFKIINDSLGHTVGDELLRRVAERLHACVREGDTVARLGGDEFVILVTRISSDSDADTIAHKVLAAVRLPFGVEQRDFFLTTSVGVSLYPADGIDAETLLQNADTAMYRAKEQGRDNYQLYAPAMNSRAAERLSLENRLRQALQNEELVLHYQPIVDLRNGRVRGAEALLRWRHPERGLLAPAEFIPLAEVSGLISPIGRWVLQTACAQAREWQTLGNPRFTMSVNLSPRQFLQTDLVSQVADALSSNGLDAGSLDLEITESNAMENAEITVNTLWELRRLGVGISMDDFGTGYSSLNYLKRFPIDRVKLDRSFVRDVVTNPEDGAIVRAVISMAHTLRLVVVAEGVENQDQLAFLRQHRCDEMQGFLFSPPVEPEEFQKLLIRRQPLPAIA
jgi:diguanylate cyclase (GGDEF)-like protein/PAS domain S-box-containing protein